MVEAMQVGGAAWPTLKSVYCSIAPRVRNRERQGQRPLSTAEQSSTIVCMTLPASAPLHVVAASASTHISASVPTHAVSPIQWIPADASWLSILQGCIPILIAGAVAWIGWRQLMATKAKVNLDLFKDRMEVFNATWAVLPEVITAQHYEQITPNMKAFYDMIPKGEFLFGNDVAEYMKLIRERFNRLNIIRETVNINHQTIDSADSDADMNSLKNETHDLLIESNKIRIWLLNQGQGHCQAMFGRYMSFGKWR
jgi:hypothetical protein